MLENEKQEGITIGEIIKILWKRKYLVITITLSVLVVLTLAIQLIYNKDKKYYEFTYAYEFPGIESEKYPNKEDFDYKEMISLDTLEKVKSSDTK